MEQILEPLIQKKNQHSSTIVCQSCQNTFNANRNDAKFCSSSCRSRFWLNRNNKRVITLTVPSDFKDEYIDILKQKIEELHLAKKKLITTQEKQNNPAKHETMSFETQKETFDYLESKGFNGFRLPLYVNGIFCDDGFEIKKTELGWETIVF